MPLLQSRESPEAIATATVSIEAIVIDPTEKTEVIVTAEGIIEKIGPSGETTA
jgi:hypothetical protein